MAIQSLLANKLRSFLSVLGVTIGIFCVILVYTIVDSLGNHIKDSLQSFGKNVIYIEVFPWESDSRDGYPWWKYISRPMPHIKEVGAIKKHKVSELIDIVSYRADWNNTTIKSAYRNVTGTTVIAVASDFNKIQDVTLESGRYLTELELHNGRNSIVIGATIAENIFPGINPLGRYLKVNGKAMEVVGVLKKEGDNMFQQSMDDKAIVPLNFLRSFTAVNDFSYNPRIIVKAKDGIPLDLLQQELKGAMRAIRRVKPIQDDTFALNKVTFLINYLQEFFSQINKFGLIIGMFSMLVGGFGVANIMFVSVKERTGIIGIQKALGARHDFILIQFLTEAVVLCIIGGIIGIIGVYATSILLDYILENYMDSSLRFVLTTENFLFGLFFSTIIGIFSGFFPARTASKLAPVEAIRSN